MRFSFVWALLCRLLDMDKAGSQSFVDNSSKWCTQFGCNGSRPLNHIIIY